MLLRRRYVWDLRRLPFCCSLAAHRDLLRLSLLVTTPRRYIPSQACRAPRERHSTDVSLNLMTLPSLPC